MSNPQYYAASILAGGFKLIGYISASFIVLMAFKTGNASMWLGLIGSVLLIASGEILSAILDIAKESAKQTNIAAQVLTQAQAINNRQEAKDAHEKI